MAVNDADAGAGNEGRGGLDWRVAGSAAAVAIAVTVPVALVSRLIDRGGADGEGSTWVLAVVALFAGFALSGNFAARRRPDAPLVHAAAGAGIAFALLAVATVVRRFVSGEGLSAPLIITLGLLLQITVSLAMLGAYLSMRRRGRAEPAA